MASTPNRNQNTKRFSRFLLRSGLFVAATVLFLPITLSAQQGTLTDDTYYPHPKKGDAQVLTIDGAASTSAYIKFGITSNLPTGTPGSYMEKATLKVYVSSISTAGSFNVHRVVTSWNESDASIPPNAYDPTPLNTAPVSASVTNSFINIDLTSLVQQWLGTDGQGAGGLPNYGVALVPIGSTHLNFDSKESSLTSHAAQLEMVLNHAATADTARTLTVPVTLNGFGDVLTANSGNGTGIVGNGAITGVSGTGVYVGVYAKSNYVGVSATSSDVGVSSFGNAKGVAGSGNTGIAGFGNTGVVTTPAGVGVYGRGNTTAGVFGVGENAGPGIYGTNLGGGPAGVFDGNLIVNGNLNLSGTSNINTSGNAATVTNGVYTTGSYADPNWLTSLSGNKITGKVSNATNADSATSVTGPVNGSQVSGPLSNATLDGNRVTGTVANATNAVNASIADTVKVPLALGGTNNLLSLTGNGGMPTLIINNTETGGGAGIKSTISGPGNAVLAYNNGNGAAIYAESFGGEPTIKGISKTASGGAGLYGLSSVASGIGVFGENNTNGAGVYGRSRGVAMEWKVTVWIRAALDSMLKIMGAGWPVGSTATLPSTATSP